MRSDMLAEDRLKQWHELVNTSTKEELIWINGYLSGLVVNGNGNGNGATRINNGTGHHNGQAVKNISLVFGTETGNSKRLATHLASIARKNGVNAKLVGLDQYRLSDLAHEEYFFVVISTQGEGDPPITALKFHEHIHKQELSLPNLKFGVLALGDSSYPHFCKTGEEVDAQLHRAGASRFIPLQKCDVDYEADAENWFRSLLEKLEQQTSKPAEEKPVVKKIQGRKFYAGTIINNINLNDRGSSKQTFHIEIATEEDIEYEVGDALAIIPVNKKIIVDHIFKLTGADRTTILETTKAKGTLEDLLTNHLNICFLLSSAIKKYATIIGQEIPDVRMDLIDLLRIYPLKNSEQLVDVARILSPIAPRLYSISSSPAAIGKREVHLTVSRNSFRVKEEQRFGLCSDFLGELPISTNVSFYIHKNRSFRLPAASKNVIMIGPGTGVAPFRAFLAERAATGAEGRNWFFFGEQHFVTDFLYQTEMQNFLDTGVLSKMSVAFSRDQEEKIYVQHKMKQQAKELFQWIDNGAYIYISGTKDPMSKDVEHSLLEIIVEEGNKTAEEARHYLHHLKESGRFEKDVY